MNALVLEPTEYTPEIIFDPSKGQMQISGFSRPEDVKGFYQQFFTWLDSNKSTVKEIVSSQPVLDIEFELVYFNSASSKCLLDILMNLSEIYDKKLNVKWMYEEGDEDLLEAGEEFSEALEIPFEYIETE